MRGTPVFEAPADTDQTASNYERISLSTLGSSIASTMPTPVATAHSDCIFINSSVGALPFGAVLNHS